MNLPGRTQGEYPHAQLEGTPVDPASFLSLHRVTFGYAGQAPVVRDVDLELAAGDIHCLVGRSGSGKTTLLKLAAGLLQPLAGAVTLSLPGRPKGDDRKAQPEGFPLSLPGRPKGDDRKARPEGFPLSLPGRPKGDDRKARPERNPLGDALLADRRAVGFVFQQPTLLDWLSVRDNVLLPVSLQRRPDGGDGLAADMLLEQLGLHTLSERYPRQLSGGQQSRVALARALLLRPPLLLLDEPFAALDAITREDLQRDLLSLCRTQGVTALFVTHDIAEAVFLGDRVSVLSAGRLVRQMTIPSDAARDTPAFGACCAALRGALGRDEVVA
jgi:NitT/TauT family transport system ATP-binding protein